MPWSRAGGQNIEHLTLVILSKICVASNISYSVRAKVLKGQGTKGILRTLNTCKVAMRVPAIYISCLKGTSKWFI